MSAGGLCSRAHSAGVCRQARARLCRLGAGAGYGLDPPFDGNPAADFRSGAAQFWDKERLISHSMGEHDRKSIVWDYIAVYPPGALWAERPPEPLYHGRPVVDVTEPARTAIAKAFAP